MERQASRHFPTARMTCREADILLFYLEKFSFVERAKVYERTADAVIYYTGDRVELLCTLCSYSPEKAAVPEKAENIWKLLQRQRPLYLTKPEP